MTTGKVGAPDVASLALWEVEMTDEVGTLALGVFLGYMAWYFAVRVNVNWMTSFAAVVAVLFGGLTLSFVGEGDKWLYPVGLFLGWMTYVIARTLKKGEADPPSLV